MKALKFLALGSGLILYTTVFIYVLYLAQCWGLPMYIMIVGSVAFTVIWAVGLSFITIAALKEII